MMHIVFNEVDLALFQEVVALEPDLMGEVVLIRDDYAVGPIDGLDTDEGRASRREWWSKILSDSSYGTESLDSVNDPEVVEAIVSALKQNPDEEVWIWMGQNQHDVMGYYWLIPQLKEYCGRVQVLYMNNLPFINDKGQLFYPAWLSEIPAKEFRKAKKLARLITPSEFEIDPDEFRRMQSENAMVRILEGGKKILGNDIVYFDKEILRQCSGEFQKAMRVLQNTLQRMKVRTGDAFLMHRIRELLRRGQLLTNGDVERGWKELDLRLPGGSVASPVSADESVSNKE